MQSLTTWNGVDWFGCEDDLVWEPLSGSAARPDSDRRSGTRSARRARRPRSTPSLTDRDVIGRDIVHRDVVGRDVLTPRTGKRRSSASSASAAAAPTRRVLILDVENVCPGTRRAARARARLEAVLTAAGPVDQIIAASAASQHARLDALLRAAGVHVHTRVRNGPDSADRALIAAARRFAQHGDCEVVVASNDHGFRVIAGLPGVRRVVLITVPELETARSLLKVASERRVAAA